MSLTVYDENGEERNGEERNGEDGRFDRDYYNIDKNGELDGEKSFSERDQLIMSTYVAYDYERKRVIREISKDKNRPIKIEIKSTLFSGNEYEIVGGVNGGRNKKNGKLGKYQDTEKIFKNNDKNTGYDAIIVKHISTGEEMLVNVGSESGKGTENPGFRGEDWRVNFRSGLNGTNEQHLDSVTYLKGLVDKGHNIRYVGGNSLGGGNTNYSGYVLGDDYPHISFLSYNPAGIPTKMLYKGEKFPPNVYSFVSSADFLYGVQTGGGNVETHMKYPNYSILQIGMFGVDTIEVDHRGVGKPSSNYRAPAVYELLPFDLITGEIITKEGYSFTSVKLTPQVLTILANNYNVEVEETLLINNSELSLAKDLVSEENNQFKKKLDTNVGGMFSAINDEIDSIIKKMNDIQDGLESVANNSSNILVDLASMFSSFSIETVENILSVSKTVINNFYEPVELAVINPLGTNYDVKLSQVLGNLENDLNEVSNEFINIFPYNSNIASEMHRVASNFDSADNNNNNLVDMNTSSKLQDGSMINYKDYEYIQDLKDKVDTAIDTLLSPYSPIIIGITGIKSITIDNWLVDVVKFFTKSTEELEAEKKQWEKYTLYSSVTCLLYNNQNSLDTDERAYANHTSSYLDYDVSSDFKSEYVSLLGKSSTKKENALAEIEKKLAASMNIEDTINTLQSTNMKDLVLGIVDYYKPLIKNVALDFIICKNLMLRLDIIALNNYGFNQSAKNLNEYLVSDDAVSQAITKISDKHKEYMSNFKLWHQEICDITVEDIELESII